MNSPQYLEDLRNGETLSTVHFATGQRRNYQWHAETETVLIHVTNKGQAGTTTQRDNWKMGTLQLSMAKRSDAFQTSF